MAQIVSMPKLGFDMAEGTLIRWVVQEGEPISKGSILAEIETDKATVEVESNYDGVVAKHLVEKGAVVPVNTPIAVITTPGEEVDALSIPSVVPAASSATPIEPEPVEQKLVEEGDGKLPGGVRSSPVARRLAEEAGLDLREVHGTGPAGRITKGDVEAYLAGSIVKTTPATQPAPMIVSPLQIAGMETEKPVGDMTVPINRLRSAIGRRMTEVKQQVPHFYITHEYDVAALMDLRSQVNEFLHDEEKTSLNDYLLKAVALTLREFPNLNASYEGAQIRLHGAVNIGVAVAVEGGLLTVVCRDTDRKPVRLISREVRAMAQRAREGKVRPDDIEGSTFSVSNLGMFDVEHFIAIINPPEAAILAVGSAREIPVVKDGQVMPGWRMRATISVDHRVSDGAEAARFLQALATYIEQPLRLMI